MYMYNVIHVGSIYSHIINVYSLFSLVVRFPCGPLSLVGYPEAPTIVTDHTNHLLQVLSHESHKSCNLPAEK